MRRRGGGDPHWITVRFVTPDTKCKCGHKFVKGERAFYYPNDRTLLCSADDCGVKASQDFREHAFDEAQMTGGW